jgi:hypothetical protein
MYIKEVISYLSVVLWNKSFIYLGGDSANKCDGSYRPSPNLRTSRAAPDSRDVSGRVSAPFTVYSSSLTLHPLSSLPLDFQIYSLLVPGL